MYCLIVHFRSGGTKEYTDFPTVDQARHCKNELFIGGVRSVGTDANTEYGEYWYSPSTIYSVVIKPQSEVIGMDRCIIMTTSENNRKVRIGDIPQGTNKQMIDNARAKCGKYLKLLERPLKFEVVEDKRSGEDE